MLRDVLCRPDYIIPGIPGGLHFIQNYGPFVAGGWLLTLFLLPIYLQRSLLSPSALLSTRSSRPGSGPLHEEWHILGSVLTKMQNGLGWSVKGWIGRIFSFFFFLLIFSHEIYLSKWKIIWQILLENSFSLVITASEAGIMYRAWNQFYLRMIE